MGKNNNVVKEAITPPIAKKDIDTVNKTEISQASKRKKDKSSSNKYDKGKSFDKSRSTQGTETEEAVKSVNKSRSISWASTSDKITKLEKPKEINISEDNSSLSGMSGHGKTLSIITPDKNVFLVRIKKRKLQTLQSKENNIFKN